MGYWIFDSLAKAEAYTDEIERIQGIPRPGTDTWGDPMKSASADLWAVVASNGYPVPDPTDAIEHLDELPDDWWNTP